MSKKKTVIYIGKEQSFNTGILPNYTTTNAKGELVPNRYPVPMSPVFEWITKSIASGATHIEFTAQTPYDESSAETVEIRAYRLEEEPEEIYQARISEENKKEEEAKQWREGQDRRLYESLKKKFGNEQ